MLVVVDKTQLIKSVGCLGAMARVLDESTIREQAEPSIDTQMMHVALNRRVLEIRIHITMFLPERKR